MNLVPRPTSLATSYAENYVQHPGYTWTQAVNSFLPEQNAQDVIDEIERQWASTGQDRLVLNQELQKFQSKLSEATSGKQTPSGTVDVTKCSMDNVLEALMDATDRGKTNKRDSVYRYLCTIGKHHKALSQYVALVPQGDYGQTICGAFTILLDAAARIHLIDNIVWECLSSIPATLQKATTYMSIYREQQPLELIQRGVELYKSVIKALTECVRYCQNNASKREVAKRFFGSIVKGDHYNKALKDAVNAITHNVNAVEEAAKMCGVRRLGTMYEVIMQEKHRQEQAKKIEQEKDRQMVGILNAFKDHLDSNGSLDHNGHLIELVKDPDRASRPRKKRKKSKPVSQPEATAEWPPEQESQHAKVVDAPTVEDLLMILGYNQFVPAQDLAEALNLSIDEGSQAMRRLAQAASSSELRTFLRTPSTSSVLVINANCEDTSVVSPLSFLDAQVATLILSPTTIPLVYFCSLHAESWDPRASATGLLSSLIGQLITYPDLEFDLSFIDVEARNLLQVDNLLALLQLFLSLLHQLPSKTYVLCVIDEVSVYETSERREGLESTLATLMNRVIRKQSEANFPVFKLLLTDGASTGIDGIVGRENVLDLNDEGESEDEWDASEVVGRVLKA